MSVCIADLVSVTRIDPQAPPVLLTVSAIPNATPPTLISVSAIGCEAMPYNSSPCGATPCEELP